MASGYTTIVMGYHVFIHGVVLFYQNSVPLFFGSRCKFDILFWFVLWNATVKCTQPNSINSTRKKVHCNEIIRSG